MGDCRKACAMVFNAIAKAVASTGSIDPAGVGTDFTMKMSSLEEASNTAMLLCRSIFIHVCVLESFRICTCAYGSYGSSSETPTGSHESEWDEILWCLSSIHINRVAVTTYSMSDENTLCRENLCTWREYEDLFTFLASVLKVSEFGTITRTKKEYVMPLSTLCGMCWHSIITRLVVPTPDTKILFAKDISFTRGICCVRHVGFTQCSHLMYRWFLRVLQTIV